MDTKTLNTSLFLFPPISYFSAVKSCDQLCIDSHEHYQKRSYRNRYDILSANGKMTLSIPLKKGKNQQMAVKEVLIAYDENWQRQHLATLRTCYGSAPYFEYYFPAYEKMFQKKFNYLYDFNYAALTLVLALLKLSIPIHESDAYVEDKPMIISIPKPYHQVFEEKFGFVENLSIIDLILNKGPEARVWL